MAFQKVFPGIFLSINAFTLKKLNVILNWKEQPIANYFYCTSTITYSLFLDEMRLQNINQCSSTVRKYTIDTLQRRRVHACTDWKMLLTITIV